MSMVARFFLLLVLGVALIAPSTLWARSDASSPHRPTQDVYYQTEGIPQSLPAAAVEPAYPQWRYLDNRIFIWVVTQQHTYFGGFVLALPLFALLLEFIGMSRRDVQAAKRYDGLGRDVLRVGVLSMTVTALLGSVMLGAFLTLYPDFMQYMGSTFQHMMPVYAGVFVGESFLLVLYYYSWTRLASGAWKWIHMSLGVLANGMGVMLLLLANAWASFMMAPAGVNAEGQFLGNVWHLLHSPLWNPLNAHRFLADIMSGGAVVVAYAAYRFLKTQRREERAYYDWMSYVFIVVMVCALLPMPFAGYWLMRSVFTFRQEMGMTMMGGLLSWLFVVQASTIGALFLGINYYIWQSLGRLRDGARYHPHFKCIVGGLMLAFLVWFTPHTIAMTPGEMKAMGAAQHPVIGQFGVMSAKNGAINIMVCLTALSYLLYRRANRVIAVPWARAGNIAIVVLFAAGMANIIWVAIYGFYIPAYVRVGLSLPQGVTTAGVLIGGLLINHWMLKGSECRGPVEWGKISVRGMVALFGVAATFSWVMGLMGYIRSAGRLGWHVHEVLEDLSPWSFTPQLAFAAKMVTVNMAVFWVSVFCLFWLSTRESMFVVEDDQPTATDSVSFAQTFSRKESA